MAASTEVKYFHSAMTGAPTLSGTAGTLIDVLDACLVNGFGSKTLTSLVVSGGVATATVAGGIGSIEADVVITVAGSTPAGLNGQKRVLTNNATTFTFDATGISDQTATGTITVMLTPAGWSKVFAGTSLAVYRANNVTGTRCYLRVDDTSTTNARVVGYETMSDINTGTGRFPTDAQVTGGNWWPKASAAGAAARTWTVIADDKTVYVHLHTVTTNPGSNGATFVFGDYTPRKSGDAYASVLSGYNTDGSNTTGTIPASVSYVESNSNTSDTGTYTPRTYSGLGGSVRLSRRGESNCHETGHSGSSSFGNYTGQWPNGPDNSLILSRVTLVEQGVVNLRGVMRGVLVTPQKAGDSFSWRDKVAGTGVYAGRKLLAIKGGSPANTGLTGIAVTFFDIYGPWG